MEEGSIAVLVDAKEEYTKQLISVLKPCIYQGIKSIYLDAKDICNQDNTPEKVLMVFQDLLSRIPKWSQDIITKEFERIVSVSKCDYIEDLLKVIYVSHIKVLTIVHSAQKNKKLSLKVPNGGHFIHLCYIECAREFWKDPYLFSENANKYELQKNMRDSENMISECIAETIRKQLPVRHILKEFLNEPDEEIEEADDDVREPVNKKYMKKLETVVKKELKTTGKSTGSSSGEIDIDLIRKVIREELNTRPQQENDVIKKELVETVVEKIVEQAAEAEADTNLVEAFTPAIETPVSMPMPIPIPKVEETKIENQNSSNQIGGKAAAENDKEVQQPSESTNTRILASEHIEKTDSSIKKDIIENKDSIELETGNVSANNLESLLDELTTRTPSENETKNTKRDEGRDDSRDEIALEDSISINESVKEQTTNEKTAAKENIKESAKLRINDVDEINLNLDELDEEEITFGESDLEEVNIKPKSNSEKNENKNEIKKDNTKYIFFNE